MAVTAGNTMRTLICLLAAMLILSHPGFGEDEERRVLLDDFKKAMKSGDASSRLAAVRTAAEVVHEDVAAALAKHLSDKEARVRAEVARALGRQGIPKYGRQLLAKAKKWDRDKRVAVLGYLEGLSLLPDKASIGTLAGIVRRILSEPRMEARAIGEAAAGALGAIPKKETVDQLVSILDLTRPLGPARGYISEEVRILRTSLRKAIFAALAKLTDRHVKVTDVWQRWWKKAGRGFAFPVEQRDLDAQAKYEDDAYGFVLEKPAESWSFVRSEDEFVIVKLIHRVSPRSGNADVELYLEAYALTEYATQSPAQAAAWADEWAETSGFKKDGAGRPMLRSGPDTTDHEIAGQKGKLWRASGTTSWGRDVVLRKFFFVKDGLLYTLTTEAAIGISDDLQAELERAVASLCF